MTLFFRMVVASVLSLLAACDRNVYIGHDTTLALHDVADTGTAEPSEPDPTAPDAGAVAQAAPTIPQAPAMQAEPMPAPACDMQHADCDRDPSNGCETDLTKDRDHCGVCSASCETPDCSCDNGKLTLHCDNGHVDCDGMLSNGCETNTMTSMQHCGTCQRACHTNGHDVTGAMCVSGRCEITCEPRISPEADCDGNPDNGCETYLLYDAQHCGQCGNACLNCEAGVCMI